MEGSGIYLKKGATGELVKVNLFDEVTDGHLEMWTATWQPAMQIRCADREMHVRPEDHHWDWKLKAEEWRPLLSYRSFAIECEGGLQGMMLASDYKSARLNAQFGKQIVYIEYLATAPWNRPEIQKPVRYRGVGSIMIAAAVELSFELGYGGRLGLHSLPAAEAFYRDVCGMTKLGIDAAYEGLMYFEMTGSQAKKFRAKP